MSGAPSGEWRRLARRGIGVALGFLLGLSHLVQSLWPNTFGSSPWGRWVDLTVGAMFTFAAVVGAVELRMLGHLE